MKNWEVSWVLLEIADLLEIKGEDPFKARAYRRAAQEIEALLEPIENLAAEDRLCEIPGVGKGLGPKIAQIIATGTCDYLENLRKEVPEGLLEILGIPGVGPRTAALLHEALGVSSLEELEAAAKAHRVREVRGMGIKTEQNILRGIEMVRSRGGRVPLGVARRLADGILEKLRAVPGVERLEVVGSIRRAKETIGDIDLLAASNSPSLVTEALLGLPRIREVLAHGDTKATVVVDSGVQVDLLVVEPASFWTALHHFTGSAKHNVKLRDMARTKGLKINEYGVFDEQERKLPVAGEEGLYGALGLEYIPPELREDSGEIEAAEEGRLPELVSMGQVRGDLHVHTNWSDGVNSPQEMARAAREMGYEYLGVCDHSGSLTVARGLSAEKVLRQKEAIEELNRGLTGLRVLAGIEVDIRADGSLDYPDSILAELDVVVASVHSGFRQEEEVMTERIISATKNRHVDIIGHPTGRLLGRRDAYRVNVDRVLEAAARSGTVLEINASPDRLDLGSAQARRAKEYGVRVAINTDAHGCEQLGEMSYGVATARRGWLEASDVVNTLRLEQLLEILR